jgi:hypothetical protein
MWDSGGRLGAATLDFGVVVRLGVVVVVVPEALRSIYKRETRGGTPGRALSFDPEKNTTTRTLRNRALFGILPR